MATGLGTTPMLTSETPLSFGTDRDAPWNPSGGVAWNVALETTSGNAMVGMVVSVLHSAGPAGAWTPSGLNAKHPLVSVVTDADVVCADPFA
jgi:hypothetical protein